jgi:hypothetical protein
MIKREDYQNKQIINSPIQKESFVFPEYGEVIQAETREEAEKLLQAKLKKLNK